MLDIGRVFSISFAMLRERFWGLAGMWAVFLAIQMAASTVLTVVIAVIGMAGVAGLGAAFDDPAAIGGFGIGMMVFLVVFYAAYVVLLMAQQAAMVTLASPLEPAVFGDAMMRGFRSCVPFLVISVVMLAVYFLGGIAVVALASALSMTGSASGGVFAFLVMLASVPLLLFLACRFSVLVPVVAVDQVWGPIAAMRRSWSVTRGKTLRILVAMIGYFAIALVAVLLPFALIFAAADTAQNSPGLGIGLMVLGFLFFVPVGIGFMLYSSTFLAALHSEVTGGGAERLEEVFA